MQEKSGFVPNVFLTLAYRPDEFRAFFAYHDALMDKDSGLTKAEREMIVVATSSANQCHYCVVAHGAILRIRAKNPQIADQIAINYRKADITPRQTSDARFRHEGEPGSRRNIRAGLCRHFAPRFQRRRHLGYRGDFRILRAVEPDGQCYRDAPERRILHDGTFAEVRRFRGSIALLDWSEIVLRLGAATLAGGLIGLNRDLHGKPIGLRTLGLVGLATAMVVVLAAIFGMPTKLPTPPAASFREF